MIFYKYIDRCGAKKTIEHLNIKVSPAASFNDPFELDPALDARYPNLKSKFCDTFDASFRIYCLTTDPESILMWSHYAEKHSGCVIGFEISEDPFRKVLENYQFSVKYGCERSLYDPENPNCIEGVLNVAQRKCINWRYEREYRLIFPREMADANDLVDITALSIRSVIFGCRSDVCPNWLKEMFSLLSSPNFKHVKVGKISKSESKYSLAIKWLDAR